MAINVLHEGQLRPGVTIEVRYATLYGYSQRGPDKTAVYVFFGGKDLPNC